MKAWIAAAIVIIAIVAYTSLSSEARVEIYVDDVGNQEQLARVIEVLDSAGVDATYCIIPTRLSQENAELLRGRKICLHGFDHYPEEFVCDYATAGLKIKDGLAILEGQELEAEYFRAPWDMLSFEAEGAVAGNGLALIYHTPDYFFENSAPEATASVLKEYLRAYKKLAMTIHLPMPENSLNALEQLVSE